MQFFLQEKCSECVPHRRILITISSKACDLAHAKGARIHVTCNTLPRNNEIPHLQEFMENAQACGVDAFIIADLGVFEAAKSMRQRFSATFRLRRE